MPFRSAWVCLALLGMQALPAQPVPAPLKFEVASVKPSAPDARGGNVIPDAGESLTISNVPLARIITYAYDIRDFQLARAPGWISAERFDIVAKAGAAERANVEPGQETRDQHLNRVARVRERLRSLLGDRFDLRTHVEQREQTVLALRVAKGGPKLAAAAKAAGNLSTNPGRIQGFGAPVSMLATQLSVATGLIVQDETGLGAAYDFVLEYAPDDKDESDTRPSIQTAVTEQLGLRLDQIKAPVKTVVIDHVERPSAN